MKYNNSQQKEFLSYSERRYISPGLRTIGLRSMSLNTNASGLPQINSKQSSESIQKAINKQNEVFKLNHNRFGYVKIKKSCQEDRLDTTEGTNMDSIYSARENPYVCNEGSKIYDTKKVFKLAKSKIEISKRSTTNTSAQNSYRNTFSQKLEPKHLPKIDHSRSQSLSQIHDYPSIYQDQRSYNQYFDKILSASKPVVFIPPDDLLKSKSISEIAFSSDYPNLDQQSRVFKEKGDERQLIYFLDDKTKNKVISKVSQKDKVDWLCDVIPSIDDPDQFQQDRDEIMHEALKIKKDKKQRYTPEQQEIMMEYQMTLQILRKNPYEIGEKYKIEYLENGKIDVNRILKKFNNKRKMFVKPHQFKFSKTEKEVFDQIIERHKLQQNSSNFQWLFRNQQLMAKALFLDGQINIQPEIQERKTKDLYQKYVKEQGSNSNEIIGLHNSDLFEYIQSNQNYSQFSQKIDLYQKFKKILSNSFTTINENDPRFAYLNEVDKSYDILKPILQHIENKKFTAFDLVLNQAHCQGIKAACKIQNIISEVILHRNKLNDQNLMIILEGLDAQKEFKSLKISNNEIDQQSISVINKIITKTEPFNLIELKINKCKIQPKIIQQLLEQLNDKSYLRTLALVSVPLNSKSFDLLCFFIKSSQTLRILDLSWNDFSHSYGESTQNNKLLKSICRNENLQDINLGWNSLIFNPKNVEIILPKKQTKGPKNVYQIIEQSMKYLKKIIKNGKNLMHLNLTRVGLNENQIKEIIKVSKNLKCLHLCQNISCSDLEQFGIPLKPMKTKFSFKSQFDQKQAIYQRKIQNKIFENETLNFSNYDNVKHNSENRLIISNNEISNSYDGCWICNRDKFTVLFWSPKIMNEGGHFDSNENTNQIKFGEKPVQMHRLIELLDQISPQKPNFLKIMGDEGYLAKNHTHFDLLNTELKIQYIQMDYEFTNARIQNWSKVFKDYISSFCNDPEIINGDLLFSDDLKNIFVFIGYLPPGKNDFIIRHIDAPSRLEQQWVEVDLASEIDIGRYKKWQNESRPVTPQGEFQVKYSQNSAVISLRESEISVVKNEVKYKQYVKQESVFSEMKDNYGKGMLNQCWNYDKIRLEMNNFIQETETVKQVEEFFSRNFKEFKMLYDLIQAQITSKEQYPHISESQLINMIKQLDIPVEPSKLIFAKNFKRIDMLRLFVQISNLLSDFYFEDQECSSPSIVSPQKRKELSASKLTQEKIPEVVQVLQRLLKKHLKPFLSRYHGFSEPFNSSWNLQTSEVDAIFQANKNTLQGLFGQYSNGKTMSLNSVFEIFDFDEKTLIKCYALSRQSVQNEVSIAQYFEIQFHEFLELIGRVAVFRFWKTDGEQRYTLDQKIYFVIRDICPKTFIKNPRDSISARQQKQINRIFSKAEPINQKFIEIPTNLKNAEGNTIVYKYRANDIGSSTSQESE